MNRLEAAQQAVQGQWYGRAPLAAATIADAVERWPGYDLGLCLWMHSKDGAPMWAGLDWLELLEVEPDGYRVNRIIEPIYRERVELLASDTVVMVFEPVEEAS